MNNYRSLKVGLTIVTDYKYTLRGLDKVGKKIHLLL